MAKALNRTRGQRPLAALFGYGLLGAVVGCLSLLILPASFIGASSWRALNLAISPVLAGLVMSWVGRLRSRGRGAHTRLSTFWAGWGFAFGMGVMRYLWAH